LALIDAGVPMKDFVVACAAGYVDGTPILDLNYMEDSSGNPDLPIAIFPKTNKVTMLQMDSKLPLDTLEKVLNLAVTGCQQIYQMLVETARNSSQELLESRGLFTS
jgi:exosome complex component RRP41